MLNDGPMTDDQLATALAEEERAAVTFRDSALAQEQENAIDFYEAEPFGDEEEGRSQIVAPVVAEVVDYMTISVLRTCVSGDRVVEFEPKKPGQEQAAEEATEAVSWAFMRGQDGYKVLHDWVQSGLIEKIGVVKTACIKERRNRREQLTVDAEQLAMLDVEGALLDYADNGDGTFLARVQYPEIVKRYIDMPIPSEEFLFSPRTRHEDESYYIAHKCRKTLSDLIEMGFDPEVVEGLPTGSRSYYDDSRDYTRWQDEYDAWVTRRGAMREVLLLEEYVRIDRDGDGIAELLKVFRVDNTILEIEEVAEQPFVVFTPFPRAHRMVGNSLADKVMDIQRTKSVIMRQTLDGLYLSNRPRGVIDESAIGDNTIDDWLTPGAGVLVRVKSGGRIEPLGDSFDVTRGLAMLEFVTGEQESRTGITRLNQGLDADALNKMLCVETPVPMADGSYKRLGDVQDGDWLIGGDGEPVYTIRAHKIHEPERAYRIRFASGEEVDAGGEHLWTVQTDNDKRYGKSQTVDTDKLFDMLQGKGRVYIPRVARPQAGAHRDLPLDPYMLGTWLGDGSCHAPRITTMEAETVEYAEAWAEGHGGLTVDKQQNSGRATSYYVKGLYPVLRSMKMLKRGDAAQDVDIIGKHIPEEYFRASYRQRLELLRGLMDTDGCHHSNALCVFVQKGGRLLSDFVRLVESLGGWPSVRPASASGAYQVTFSLADCPFRLKRKAAGWKPAKANALTQVIKSIDRINVKPMRCLTVAAEDGLFCVGRRFTVTHNTATGTALMQAQGQQMEEYVARTFAEAVARLFGKKLRLMKTEGDPLMVRIDGEIKQVDPAGWDPDMDVSIRVGLGSGRKEQRLAYRAQLFQALAAIGERFPRLVDEQKAFNLVKGFVKDTALGLPTDFVNDPGQMPPEEPKPDPAMVEAEAKTMIEAEKIEQKRQEAELTAALKQQEMAAKIELMRQEAAAKLELERERAAAEAQMNMQRMAFEQQLAERRFEVESEIARVRADRDAEIAQAKVPQNRPGGDLDK